MLSNNLVRKNLVGFNQVFYSGWIIGLSLRKKHRCHLVIKIKPSVNHKIDWCDHVARHVYAGQAIEFKLSNTNNEIKN